MSLDVARLHKLEAVVERGSKTVLDVAAALAEIRDARLYRGTHSSFADYVEERFGFGRRWADMLIKRTRPELPPAPGSGAVQEDADAFDLPVSADDDASESVGEVGAPPSQIDQASAAFKAVLSDVKRAKASIMDLVEGSHSVFLSLPTLSALLTNLQSEIVWGQPSMPCPHDPMDEAHSKTCQCKGAMWLPRSQTQEGKARARGKRRD